MTHMKELQYTPRRVLWLDMDGTVRKGFDELGRFVNRPEDVEVFPEVPGIISVYKRAGWRVVGITNQGGIATGYVSAQNAWNALAETMRQCGPVFDLIEICPHHPDGRQDKMTKCWCRKPNIGLVVQAATRMGEKYREVYAPDRGLFVGDREEDRGCAMAAGIPFMHAEYWRGGKLPA